MAVSGTTSGVTSAQQLELARARFASFATAQPTTTYQNGTATSTVPATTGSQETGTTTPAGTVAPGSAATPPPPLVIPHIKLAKDARMDDTLSAISGAMVDPTTSQAAVTVLYDFQKSLFDMQKQSASLWMNGSP